MKKSNLSKVFISLAGSLLLFGCEIGLGEAVDTEAPNLEIVTPVADAIVRDAFTVSGSYSDDGAISDVSVLLERTDGKYKDSYYESQAKVVAGSEEGKGTWICNINPTDKNSKILDGTYQITVSITDEGGHISKQTRQFTIDNTPPVIVLNSPSSKIIANPTSYGSVLNVEGKAADDSDVDSMDFILYNEKGIEVGRKTINSVSTQIDLNIAEWGDDLYNKIYGTNKEAGTKAYYIGLEAFDGARKIPYVEGDRGNSTKTFYMTNDFSNIGDFKTSIAYKILNGTQENPEKYKEWQKALSANKLEKATISLNPVNNPYFDVQGYEPLGDDIDFTAESSPYEFMNKNKLTVNIYVGRDKTSIKTETIGIYLKACDKNGNLLTDAAAKTVTLLAPYKDRDGNLTGAPDNTAKITAVGSTSYRWESDKLDANDISGLDIGSCYLVDVVAYDYKGIGIRNENNYGIKITTTSTAPSISIDQLNDVNKTGSSLSIGNSAAFYVAGHVVASSDITNLSVYLNAEKTPIGALEFESVPGEEKTDSEVTNWLSSNPKPNGLYKNSDHTTAQQPYYNFCFVVPAKICDESSFTININATDSTGQTSKKEIEVNNDVEPPVFGDFTVTPYVDVETAANTYVQKVNGIVTIKQLVSDNNSIKNTYYSLDEGENWIEVGKTTSMNFTVDTTVFTDKAEKTIYLKAVDAAGNEKILPSAAATAEEKPLKLNVDQSTDAPVINLSNTTTTVAPNAADISAISLFGTSANNQILGTISDDDGIAKVKVEYSTNGTAWTPLKVENSSSLSNNPTTFNLKVKVPEAEGKYQIKITVEDKEKKTDYATKIIGPFLIAVDDGAPELVISTASGADQYKASTFTIYGTLNDEWAELKAYKNSSCSAGQEASEITINKGTWDAANSRYNWTAVISAGNTADTKTYYFQAVDEFGQKTTKPYTFSVDPNPPRFSITSFQGVTTSGYGYVDKQNAPNKYKHDGASYPTEKSFGNTTEYFTVKGEVSDEKIATTSASGVNGRYFYYYISDEKADGTPAPTITDGHYTPAKIVNGEFQTETGWNTCTIKQTQVDSKDVFIWEAPISFAGRANNDSLIVYFAVMDNAGNYSVVDDNPSEVLKIKIDESAPQLKGIPDLSLGATSKITAIARDEESDRVIVSVKRNGVAYSRAGLVSAGTEVDENGDPWTSGDKYYKYSVNLLPTDLVKGDNKFTLVIKDTAGNQTESTEIIIQNDAPVITSKNTGITSTAKDDDEFTYVKDSFTSTATVTCETGNMLGTISWKDTYDDAGTPVTLNSGSFLPTTGEENSKSITIESPKTDSTPKTIADYEGKQVTRTVTAANIFGTTGEWTYKFIFDVTPPAIISADTKIGEIVNSGIASAWYRDGTLPVEGKYTEAGSGISKITYTLKDGNGNTVTTNGSIYTTKLTGADAGKESFSSNISGFTEGTGANEITLTALDKAGNTSVTTSYSKVRIDNSAPKIVAGIAPGAADGSASGDIWYRFSGETSWKKLDKYLLTNLKNDVEISGSYKDGSENDASYKQSGVKDMKLTVNGKTIQVKDYVYDETTTSWKTSDFKRDSDGTYKTSGLWYAKVEKSDLTDVTGSCSAKLTVTDAAGNKNDSSNFTVRVDTAKPTVTATAPKAAVAAGGMNGKITISGKVVDALTDPLATDGTLNSISIKYSIDNGKNWYVIDTSDDIATTDSQYNFSVKHEFSTQEKILAVKADSSALELKADAATQIQNVKVKITAVDEAGWESDPAEFIIKIDRETDRPEIQVMNNVTLKNGTDEMSNENRVGITSSELSFSVSDDDEITKVEYSIDGGTYKSATVSGTSYKISLPDDGKQTIDFKITTKDEDNVETVFETSAAVTYNLLSPKVTDGTNKYGYKTSTTKATKIYAKVDTKAPEVKPVEFRFTKADGSNLNGNWSNSIVSTQFGGTKNRYFKLRVYATDVNGIENVSLKINGLENPITFTPTLEGTAHKLFTIDGKDYEEWISENIDVNSDDASKKWASGTKSGSLIVSDGCNSATEPLIMIIDNEAPTVTITSPSATDDPVYGDVVVRGSSEASAILSYTISYDGENSPTSAKGNMIKKWTGYNIDENGIKTGDITNGTVSAETDVVPYTVFDDDMGLSWTIYFDGKPAVVSQTHLQQLNSYLIDSRITTAEDITSENFKSIVNTYLWIKAEDEVGNYSETPFLIKLDPQGGRPTISIDYPESEPKDNKIDSFGGAFKVYGSAEDLEEGVQSVWLQIVSDKHRTVTGTTFNEALDETVDKFGKAAAVNDVNNEISAITLTIADLNYWKTAGYKVQKMKGEKDAGGNIVHKEWAGTLAADEKASDYAILCEITGSTWRIKLNEKNEFSPVGSGSDAVATLAMRVYAYDGGKLSYPKTKKFKIDNDKPYITDIKLFKYTADKSKVVARKEYISGVCVKDNWSLVFTANDNDSISSVKYQIRTGNVWGVTETASLLEGGNNETNKKDYKIDLATGTADSVGTLEVKVTVEDGNANANQREETYTIKYDNKAPKIANSTNTNYGIKPKVQQSNGFYTIKSFVSDAESGVSPSGIDSVAFYFLRRSDKSSKVYDPMQIRTGEVNIHGVKDIDQASESDEVVYSEGLFWKTAAIDGSIDENIFKITAADSNIHKGGICKVGGTNYIITDLSSDGLTITLNGSPDATATKAYFGLAMIVNNTVSEFANGNKATDGYYIKPGNDDGDRMIEVMDGTSVEATWEAQIVSRNIPDGPIEIHYVAFDKAGNYSIGIVGNKDWNTYKGYASNANYKTADVEAVKEHTPTSNTSGTFVYTYKKGDEAYISNNAPRIVGVTVGTDFDGNGTFGNIQGEVQTKYYSSTDGKPVDVTSKYVVSTKYDQANAHTGYAVLRLKSDSMIKPEIIGGNGDLYYESNISNEGYKAPENLTYTKNEAAFITGTSNAFDEYTDEYGVIEESLRRSAEITFTEANLKKLGNSTVENPTWFSFRIWDSTEGTEKFVDSQYATLQVALANRTNDDTAPNVSVDPFYWNNQNDNSLAGNSYKNGHIDLSKDLVETSGEAWSREKYVDPKVSGKISFRGTALDDHRLGSIWAKFGDIAPTNCGTVDGGYYCVATLNNGTWTVAGDNLEIADGTQWKFTVEKTEWSEDGQLLYWQLDIDTSALSTGFANDVKLEMMARDSSYTDEGKDKHQSSAEKDSKVVGGNETVVAGYEVYSAASFNVPFYQVDVVPYISGVKDADGNDANRSRLGRYPVQSGTTITIEGFNFGTAAPTVYRSKTKKDETGKSLGIADETPEDDKITASNPSTKSFKITVPENSGYIRAVWGTVATPNNSNINKRYNISEGLVVADADSGFAKANKAGTNFWSDDVYLSVWNVKTNFQGSINPHSGVIKKVTADNSDGGKIYTKETGSAGVDPVSDMAGTYFGALTSDDLRVYTYDLDSKTNNTIDKRYTFGTNNTDIFRVPADAIDVTIVKGVPYYVVQDNWVGNVDANCWGPGLFFARAGWQWDKTNLNSDGTPANESNYHIIIEKQGNSGTARGRKSDTGYDYVLSQFKNPRIVGWNKNAAELAYDNNGQNFAASTDYIYISYYDSYARCLKYAAYRAGHRINANNKLDYVGGEWGSATGKSNGKGGDLSKEMRMADDMTGGKAVVAGFDTLNDNPSQFKEEAGEWSDIMIAGTASNEPRPVIVYYNKTKKCVEVAYGKTAFPTHAGNVVARDSGYNSATDNTETAWTKSTGITPDTKVDFGRYLSAAMDKDENIHIAAQDATNNKVYYMFLKKNGNTYSVDTTKTTLIDGVVGTGRWTDIELSNPNGTTPETCKPVISYINTSYLGTNNCVKVAYAEQFDSNGKPIFEAMTDPSKWQAVDQRTSVMSSVKENKADTSSAKVAVGFNANMLALDFLRDE